MSDLGLRHAQKTCLDLPHIHIQNYLNPILLRAGSAGGRSPPFESAGKREDHRMTCVRHQESVFKL